MPATLVTGASGFIASETVYQLLKLGKTVIGTVRNESRTEGLRKVFGKEIESGQLKFAYCEIDSKEQIEKIFLDYKDIESVIHISTAGDLTLKDLKKGVIEPTVNGIKLLVEAIHTYAPQVKTFVYTSSIVTMFGAHEDQPDYEYSSKDWSPLTLETPLSHWFLAYTISKKYAELAVWDFIKANQVSFKFKSLIVPTVFGPMRIPPRDRASFNLTNQWVIDGFGATGYPNGEGQKDSIYGDVRYIAQAHVSCSDPNLSPLADVRYLIFNERHNYAIIYDWLGKRYPNGNVYKPDDPTLPKQLRQYDITDTEKDLKLKHYTLNQTLSDLLDQYDNTPDA